MLDYVSEAPGQQISDLQLIANMLFPDSPNAHPFRQALSQLRDVYGENGVRTWRTARKQTPLRVIPLYAASA